MISKNEAARLQALHLYDQDKARGSELLEMLGYERFNELVDALVSDVRMPDDMLEIVKKLAWVPIGDFLSERTTL